VHHERSSYVRPDPSVASSQIHPSRAAALDRLQRDEFSCNPCTTCTIVAMDDVGAVSRVSKLFDAGASDSKSFAASVCSGSFLNRVADAEGVPHSER